MKKTLMLLAVFCLGLSACGEEKPSTTEVELSNYLSSKIEIGELTLTSSKPFIAHPTHFESMDWVDTVTADVSATVKKIPGRLKESEEGKYTKHIAESKKLTIVVKTNGKTCRVICPATIGKKEVRHIQLKKKFKSKNLMAFCHTGSPMDLLKQRDFQYIIKDDYRIPGGAFKKTAVCK